MKDHEYQSAIVFVLAFIGFVWLIVNAAKWGIILVEHLIDK